VLKKVGSTHQQGQITTACVDAVFQRNFSSAGGTDDNMLPATLRLDQFPTSGIANCTS